MSRVTKVIDANIDEIETSKQTAIKILTDSSSQDVINLFYADKLEEVETGIKKLNDFSNKSWLMSAILLYTLIFNNSLYTQSGLSWADYSKEARERLGLDPRDITEQLSSARFFIMNSAEIERKGYDFSSSTRKLARAELATELCGDVHLVIDHLVSDSWRQFKEWYQSYKPVKAIENTEFKRDDIEIKKTKVYIQGKEAVTISDDIPEQDKIRIEKYITQIFEAIQQGYEPAIVPVYDEKEGRVLLNLRDKYRQKK